MALWIRGGEEGRKGGVIKWRKEKEGEREERGDRARRKRQEMKGTKKERRKGRVIRNGKEGMGKRCEAEEEARNKLGIHPSSSGGLVCIAQTLPEQDALIHFYSPPP